MKKFIVSLFGGLMFWILTICTLGFFLVYIVKHYPSELAQTLIKKGLTFRLGEFCL